MESFFSSSFFPSLFQLDFVLAWVSYHSFSFLLFFFPFFALLLSPSFFVHLYPFLPFLPAFQPFYLSYSFSIPLLSFSLLFFFPFLLLFILSFLPLIYSPDYSSFSPPHSFSFFVCLFFKPLNFFLVSPLCQGGCYEHKG